MSESDSEEENIIRYGTPLEPYEEDEVPSKRKFQEPADQYAVDAHGRRRFHGAFTGGFSAGYGNSVGTPEGWTPASFKSSRSEKASISNQKPEDFMDEEDRGEFGIAPRHLQTHKEFSGQKRQRQTFHDGPIPGEPVLQQLIRPVHESAAVKMLRKMGWREGQGIGDRLSHGEKRKAKEQHKVYGCYMPPEMRQEDPQSEEESSDSEFEYETLFAPDDYEPYILQRKNDRFGLGYNALSRHSVLGNLVGEYGSDAGTSKSHLLMQEKGKKISIRGQAFGVGAFEADDEDIYATEDMSHYDFVLGEKTDAKKPSKSIEKSLNVLEGFLKAEKAMPPVASYPPPALPRDYTPAAAGTRRSRFDAAVHPPRDQGLGRHELTAEARGELLGETPLPKTVESDDTVVKTSVTVTKFDKAINFVSADIEKNKSEDFIPIGSSSNEVPKVFKPFANDPQKQLRYEKYLKNVQNESGTENTNDNLSQWEKQREMIEFGQAAKLYKPLTGVMGDRFTHASQPDEALNPLCAVAKSSNSYGLATPEQIAAAEKGAYGVMTRRETVWRPEAIVCKRFNVPEIGGSKYEAKKEEKPKVSYSIFSYLESSVHDKESFTKEQSNFSGSKSLLAEPRNNTNSTPTKNVINVITTNQNIDIEPKESVNLSAGFNKRMTTAELFLKESEKDLKNKEVNTIEKFDKMNLYKSIFLSDSENTEDEEETTDKTDKDFVDKPSNKERNLSPPRGIFANIDFDELNSWKRNINEKKDDLNMNSKDKNNSNLEQVKADSSKNTNLNNNDNIINNCDVINKMDSKDVTDSNEDFVYGPKIPDNLKPRIESDEINLNFKPTFRNKDEREAIEIDSSSSSDSWVDVKAVKKKQKKKKSKKHKSKHKKSKHKKKDR